MRARYDEWAISLDPAWVEAVRWRQGWIASCAAIAALLVALDTVPSAREFFALRLGPALGLLTLAFSTLFVLDRLEARGAFGPTARAGASLCLGFLLQLFSSGLVALSSPPGSFALAGFPILSAWHHLGALRAGPQHPFAIVVHGAAMASVAAAAPDPAHAPLLAAVALVGLGGGALFGMIAAGRARADARLRAHGAALAAQSLAAFATDLEEVEAKLAEAASTEGDVQSALERARRACAALAAEAPSGPAHALLRQGLARAGRALERATALLAPAPHVPAGSANDGGAAVAVAVVPVVRAALADATRRWPALAWSGGPEAGAPDAPFAQIPDGPTTLRRMLDPLLANAAEGDGTFGASQVDVRVRLDAATGELEIDVCDDGPGLALFGGPIAGLGTTKRRGSGLGLHTAERLARGCGGTIACESRPEGGARVRLRLPAAGLWTLRRGDAA